MGNRWQAIRKAGPEGGPTRSLQRVPMFCVRALENLISENSFLLGGGAWGIGVTAWDSFEDSIN